MNCLFGRTNQHNSRAVNYIDTILHTAWQLGYGRYTTYKKVSESFNVCPPCAAVKNGNGLPAAAA